MIELTDATAPAQRPVAVLLDYNGTLADDEQIIFGVVRSIHADFFGHDLQGEEYFTRLVGRSDDELLADGLDRYPHSAATTQAFLRGVMKRRYERACLTIEVITADARRVVHALAAADVRLGVVTGAQRSQVLPALDAAGLLELFATVVALDDVEHGKPAPDGYALALRDLGVSSAQSVYAVEDSVVGLQAARAAGLRTVAVTTSQPARTLARHADHLITRLDDSLLALEPFRGIAALAAETGSARSGQCDPSLDRADT